MHAFVETDQVVQRFSGREARQDRQTLLIALLDLALLMLEMSLLAVNPPWQEFFSLSPFFFSVERRVCSGDGGTRTPDIVLAKHALSL